MNIKNKLFQSFVVATIAGLSLTAFAQQQDPALGTWKTIDDKTGQPLYLIKIDVNQGVADGTIAKVFPIAGEPLLVTCTLCKDERKDQPIVGMKLMTGLKADKPGYWSGGKILDPKDGNTYTVKMSTDDGKKMDVRGYIGIPLLGRTQEWFKVE
jgi:uncharacterized protein (DUF2147 family)